MVIRTHDVGTRAATGASLLLLEVGARTPNVRGRGEEGEGISNLYHEH